MMILKEASPQRVTSLMVSKWIRIRADYRRIDRIRVNAWTHVFFFDLWATQAENQPKIHTKTIRIRITRAHQQRYSHWSPRINKDYISCRLVKEASLLPKSASDPPRGECKKVTGEHSLQRFRTFSVWPTAEELRQQKLPQDCWQKRARTQPAGLRERTPARTVPQVTAEDPDTSASLDLSRASQDVTSQVPSPRSTDPLQQSQYPLIAMEEESPLQEVQAMQELKLLSVQVLQLGWHCRYSSASTQYPNDMQLPPGDRQQLLWQERQTFLWQVRHLSGQGMQLELMRKQPSRQWLRHRPLLQMYPDWQVRQSETVKAEQVLQGERHEMHLSSKRTWVPEGQPSWQTLLLKQQAGSQSMHTI